MVIGNYDALSDMVALEMVLDIVADIVEVDIIERLEIVVFKIVII